jgi:hypothetical protein
MTIPKYGYIIKVLIYFDHSTDEAASHDGLGYASDSPSIPAIKTGPSQNHRRDAQQNCAPQTAIETALTHGEHLWEHLWWETRIKKINLCIKKISSTHPKKYPGATV